MKLRCVAFFTVIGFLPGLSAAEDAIDRIDELLTFSAVNDLVRARVSGTLDLEGYVFPQPAPAFIEASGDALFNPRVTTFLDVQAGALVYAFAQVRADRGFDPSDERLRVRLDEYAIRVTLSDESRVNVQVGKFATVVGNWVSRHGAWDNPFVTAPVPYEHLTGLWDQAAARNSGTLLGWAHVRPPALRGAPALDKYQRLPIIWGGSYATGFAISGLAGRFTYAAELKNASLSSRPSSWTADEEQWRHPTVSGRVGFLPNQMWTLGVSASDGTYLEGIAKSTLPVGLGLGDYRQTVLAQDVGFAWHHLQVWAEFFETRFTIPRVGDADTFAYYVEAKYKFTPQFFGAVRWNEQLFGRIPDGIATETRWGANLRRFDLSAGYRFTPHTQLKLQYSLQQEENSAREYAHLFSVQCSLRF